MFEPRTWPTRSDFWTLLPHPIISSLFFVRRFLISLKCSQFWTVPNETIALLMGYTQLTPEVPPWPVFIVCHIILLQEEEPEETKKRKKQRPEKAVKKGQGKLKKGEEKQSVAASTSGKLKQKRGKLKAKKS